MRWTRLLAVTSAALALSGESSPDRYAIGQVWEYHTRAGDEGSLLKIQSIETDSAFAKIGPIYHISVIGFHFTNPRMTPVLPHAPVSRETLDQSVTVLSPSKPEFPDVRPGIAQWREAKGGVYTISVGQIIDILDKQTAHIGE